MVVSLIILGNILRSEKFIPLAMHNLRRTFLLNKTFSTYFQKKFVFLNVFQFEIIFLNIFILYNLI